MKCGWHGWGYILEMAAEKHMADFSNRSGLAIILWTS